MARQTQLSASRFPAWTLIISACALLAFITPGLEALLVYDRHAIVHGQLWRLASGNLVHFSASHFILDVAAFIIAGAIAETRGYRFFPLLCLLTSILIGIAIFEYEPSLEYFGGLSGMVTAAAVYLCLRGLLENGAWRWLCAAVLAVLIAKLRVELSSGKFLLSAISTEPFVPVPLSHLTGAVAAVLLFIVEQYRTSHESTTAPAASRQAVATTGISGGVIGAKPRLHEEKRHMQKNS